MCFNIYIPTFCREAPDPLQVVLWDSGRKVTSEYGDEDWKKLSIKGIVKRFTSHPGAVMFSAQKPDSQLLELHYKDRKDREKLYVEIQNAQGAIGAMSTKLLLKLQGMRSVFSLVNAHLTF